MGGVDRNDKGAVAGQHMHSVCCFDTDGTARREYKLGPRACWPKNFLGTVMIKRPEPHKHIRKGVLSC